jgi:hypothetical protein
MQNMKKSIKLSIDAKHKNVIKMIANLIVWRKYILENNENPDKNGSRIAKTESAVQNLVFV